MLVESKRRSLAKAVSWRVIASITTAVITWGLTGAPTLAVKVGLLDSATKLFGYFLHERLWARIKFGLAKPPEYEI